MEDWNYAPQGDDEDNMSLSSENSADLLPSIQKLAFQFQLDSGESKDRFEAAMMSQDENDDSLTKAEKWEPTRSILKNRNTDEIRKEIPTVEEITLCETHSNDVDDCTDDALQSSLPDEEEDSFHENDICNSAFGEKASLSSLDDENEKESEESSSSEDEKFESHNEEGNEKDEMALENPWEGNEEFIVKNQDDGRVENNEEVFEDTQIMMNEDRTESFTTRLEAIIKELGRVREELSKVRENCKEESEILTEALEKALAYNKSIQETSMAALGWDDRYITPPSSPPATGNTTLTNALLLENKLRIGRLNASAAYRAQLDQLEALVDKEMNTLQDNMIRLEPLNRIATDWESRQQEPKSLVYRHDYTVEVAVASSSQINLKSTDLSP